MRAAEKRIISRMKRKHHNVFGIQSALYFRLCCPILTLWAITCIDVMLLSLPAAFRISIYAAAILASVVAASLITRHPSDRMLPYSRQQEFQFLGLHNLRKAQLSTATDILLRNEEVECMKKVLEEVIFPQQTVKQALCIVGPSGCGKSTILSFFQEKYGTIYQCYDFSGNYHELKSAMTRIFGSNIDVGLSQLASKRKLVVILDQFERFFHLNPDEQLHVRRVIQALCCRNSAVILSLREEYLADFLKEFDLNNLKTDPQKNKKALSNGVLHELISIIWRTSDAHPQSGLLRPARTASWGGHTIKNNGKVYLNSPFSHTQNDPLEQMGITLFYCQNENHVLVQVDGQITNSSVMLDKCRKLFGSLGEALFDANARKPLLEQQIIMHMCEFNQKVNGWSHDELQAILSKTNQELLHDYLDHQLAACEDPFTASRLLYLYSKASSEHMFLKTSAVEQCISPQLFDPDGHRKLVRTLSELEDLQLIRRCSDGSGEEYEIAHDLITQAYLSYSENSMDRGVKHALDICLSERNNSELQTAMTQKHAHAAHMLNDHFFRNATIAAILVMLVVYAAEALIWNPWTTILARFNPYGTYISPLPLVVTSVSVIYLECLYSRMVRFYRGRSTAACKRRYILLMALATLASFAYPHFLFLDSLDLMIAALDIFFLLDDYYPNSCRAQLRAYGIKSTSIGLVFALAHVLLCLTNQSFSTDLIFIENVMFSFLAGYACIAHLTQEYLFARMIDASCEKSTTSGER